MAKGTFDLAHPRGVRGGGGKRVPEPARLRQGRASTPAPLDEGSHERRHERVARAHRIHGVARSGDPMDPPPVPKEKRWQATPCEEHGAIELPAGKELVNDRLVDATHRELRQIDMGSYLGEVLGRAVLLLLAEVIGKDTLTPVEQGQPIVDLRVAAREDSVESAGVLDGRVAWHGSSRPGLPQLDAFEVTLAINAVLMADLGRTAGDDLAGARVNTLCLERAEQALSPEVIRHTAKVARLVPEARRTHGNVHGVAAGIGDAEIVVGVEDVVSQAEDLH